MPAAISAAAFSLNADRNDQHIDAAGASSQNLEKVADRRPGRTCNKGNSAWEPWQRSFTFCREETFLGELIAKLSQSKLEGAETLRHDLIDHKLVTTSWRIKIQVSLADHFQSVVQVKLQSAGSGTPNDGTELSLIVLQREVAVPRLRPREVGDFAGHPD